MKIIREFKCDSCDKIHAVVADITQEESDSMRFINNRVSVTRNFINTENANVNVIKAGLEVIADNESLAGSWWKEMSAKYGFSLEEEIHVDFEKNFLYILKEA
jgi:hypothetical protein